MASKLRKVHVYILIATLILTNHCGQQEEPQLGKFREFTSAAKDPKLGSFRDSMNSASSNGRVSSNVFDRVNWDKAYKVFDTQKEITTFTLPLAGVNPGQFENLILVENNEGQFAYILRYEPDLDWLKSKPLIGGYDTYTGRLEMVNINGDTRASTDYVNGKAIKNENPTNGRVEACYEYTEVEWTVACVEAYGCWMGEISWIVYEVCDNTGGGETWPDSGNVGMPNGGGDPLANLGNPGTVEPEDDFQSLLAQYEACLKNPNSEWLNDNCNCKYGEDENGCLNEEDAWEEEVCTLQAFDSNPCLNSVWNKLKSSNAAASILNKFENSSWLELCLDASNTNQNSNASTSVTGTKVTIDFNASSLNRSQLSIARTFLHEIVHAELFRKVTSVGGQISQNNFPGIYDYYMRHVKNWQHEQMAAHYINTIANGLMLFDNNSQSLSYYQDIAWMGLWQVPDYNTPDPNDVIETQAWINLSPTEQNRITTAINNFTSSQNQNCQ